jgi:hypothetical protein
MLQALASILVYYTVKHLINLKCLCSSITVNSMVVLARQNGQFKKEIKKWKKDFQKPISD